jgi:hypothetical protein
MAELLEFQEFLRFKQMKSAAAAPVAPQVFRSLPPAPRPVFERFVKKIDYEFAWKHLFTRCPTGRQSEHRGLWFYMKNLYEEHPSRFRLIGELHGTAPNTYISVEYSQPNKLPVGGDLTITFHIYGTVMESKFMMSSCDIKMGTTIYKRVWLPKLDSDSESTGSQ